MDGRESKTRINFASSAEWLKVVGPLTESNVERISFGKEPGDGSAGVTTILGMRDLEYLEPKGEAI